MGRRTDLSFVNIVDVESTCWRKKTPPQGQISEIIEIGIALVEVSTQQVVGNESILVKPMRSTISKFCTELTTITQEMVDEDGIPLSTAVTKLMYQYKTRDRAWASWGDYDRFQFQRNCQEYCIAYPFGRVHYNAKNLFSLMNGYKREFGMEKALQKAGLSLEGTHHRGGDDAKNIARLFIQTINRPTSGPVTIASPNLGVGDIHLSDAFPGLAAGLDIKCSQCKKKITEPGGLAFSPPVADMVRKLHFCKECWKQWQKLYEV